MMKRIGVNVLYYCQEIFPVLLAILSLFKYTNGMKSFRKSPCKTLGICMNWYRIDVYNFDLDYIYHIFNYIRKEMFGSITSSICQRESFKTDKKKLLNAKKKKKKEKKYIYILFRFRFDRHIFFTFFEL